MKAIAITQAAADGNNIPFYAISICRIRRRKGTICWLRSKPFQ